MTRMRFGTGTTVREVMLEDSYQNVRQVNVEVRVGDYHFDNTADDSTDIRFIDGEKHGEGEGRRLRFRYNHSGED